MAPREIFHLLEDEGARVRGEVRGGRSRGTFEGQEGRDTLRYLLAAGSCVVLLLLLLLLALLLKSKLSSKFKLFDETSQYFLSTKRSVL